MSAVGGNMDKVEINSSVVVRLCHETETDDEGVEHGCERVLF